MSTKYSKTLFLACFVHDQLCTLFFWHFKKFSFFNLFRNGTLDLTHLKRGSYPLPTLTCCVMKHLYWYFFLWWLQIFYLFTKLVKNITLFNPLNLTSIYNLLIEETATLKSLKNVLMDTTKLANIDFQTPQATGFWLIRNAACHQIDPRSPKLAL